MYFSSNSTPGCNYIRYKPLLILLCYQGRSGISRGSFLTAADSTWGLSNFIVSKGYGAKGQRKAYKGVEKAKGVQRKGKQTGEHCKGNYRTISNFQHFKLLTSRRQFRHKALIHMIINLQKYLALTLRLLPRLETVLNV